MSAPTVSVVIPAHNDRHFLPALLDSLRPLMESGRAEVVLVDNGSTDGTQEAVAAYPCRYLRKPHKTSPSIARNFGVREATGDVLVFLDADVVVTPQWHAELQSRLPDLAREPLTLTGDQYHISSVPSWIEKYWFEPLRAQPKTYINGGNIITTRRVFEAAGGFDEQLETGEDVDFCNRAVRAGAQLRFNSGFVALHEGFPKTLKRFMLRERWHGTGDFEHWDKLVRSKIALMTLMFLGLHVILLAVSIAGALGYDAAAGLAATSILGIAALCVVSSAYRFRNAGPRQILAGSAVSYFYFIGRCLSALQVARRKLFAPRAGVAAS